MVAAGLCPVALGVDGGGISLHLHKLLLLYYILHVYVSAKFKIYRTNISWQTNELNITLDRNLWFNLFVMHVQVL